MFREPIIEKIKLLAVTALLALTLGITAFADVSDENERGSIEVNLQSEDTKEAIPGGSMTLFKAGRVVHDENGNYSFVLTDEFAGSGCSLDDLDAALARSLAEYAEEQGIEGDKQYIGDDGRVVFENLEIGLYLLVQEDAASGYYAVNPFLVSLPQYEEATGTYEYHVDATPKTEVHSTPVPETSPSSHHSSGGGGGGGGGSSGGGSGTGGPGGSSGEGDSGSSTWDLLPIPETGQGWAMMIAAIVMIIAAVGLIVTLSIKRKE